MMNMLAFAAGFAAGWLARSAAGSSKSAVIEVTAVGLDTVARIKRALAIEREQFEDMVAEARDLAARRRARRARGQADAEAVEHAA
jgi:hypothetical protein